MLLLRPCPSLGRHAIIKMPYTCMYNAAWSSILLQKNHLRDVVLLQKLIHEMKFYIKNLTKHLHNPELPKDGWPSNRGRFSLKGCYSQLSFRTRPAILLLNKTYFQTIIFPYAWSKESLVLSPLEVRNQMDELESESLSETVHPHGRETRFYSKIASRTCGFI